MTTTVSIPRRVAPGRRPRPRRIARYLLMWLAGGIVSVVILIPVLYSVLGGFKVTGEMVGSPALLPDHWVFNNYAELLTAGPFWQQVGNSLLVGAISTGLVVSFSALAAFVFARIRFPGREAVYTLFTLGLLFPLAVAILPLFVLLRGFDLIGNPLGVALPQAAFGLPLTIIILRPFFKSIPNELEDAAQIDGCGSFGFFWRIVLPLSRPALATVSVLAIVASWNAFFLPLLVFQGPEQWTLPLGVMNFTSEHTSDWARLLAFTSLSMAPAILFYAIAERHIVRGLTSGAVQG